MIGSELIALICCFFNLTWLNLVDRTLEAFFCLCHWYWSSMMLIKSRFTPQLLCKLSCLSRDSLCMSHILHTLSWRFYHHKISILVFHYNNLFLITLYVYIYLFIVTTCSFLYFISHLLGGLGGVLPVKLTSNNICRTGSMVSNTWHIRLLILSRWSNSHSLSGSL